jgi:hypothetical protein
MSFKSIYGNYKTLKEEMVKTILGADGTVPVFGTTGTIDSTLTKAVVGTVYPTADKPNVLATVAWVDSKISNMGGGTVGGTGTSGKLAKFSDNTTLADSIIAETTSAITVSGSVTATAFSTTGSLSVGNITATGAISSATISTTGNATISGSLAVSSDITTATLIDLKATDSTHEKQIRWRLNNDAGYGLAFHGAGMGLYDWVNTTSLWYVNRSSKLFQMSGSLEVSGSITANGEVSAYSDSRLKTDVQPIQSALDKVLQLSGVSYTRTDMDSGTQLGFIAQELLKVIPEVVNLPSTEQEYHSVKYNGIIALLVEAVKELNEKINNKQ